jgi:polyhydroxyalkanoate synthase
MMHLHNNVRFVPLLCEAPGAGAFMPKRARPSFDPLEAAFRAGQAVYKEGLISVVNARRRSMRLPPVEWPEVGATPSRVVWREGAARLLRYRPLNDAGASKSASARVENDADASKKVAAPLLLVCSLINRPYVLDLIEERSVVRRLLASGRDVWLLDWGTPEPDDAERGLEGYALERLPRAAAAVLTETGAPSLHVLGYCMGGTFALIAAAEGKLPLASLVALATPVDLHDGGLLSAWSRAPGFDAGEVARVYGNVPPHLTGPAFKLLDPVGLATKLVHLDGKMDDDAFLRFFLAMETWLEDSVAFPGRAFADWMALYRDNGLKRRRPYDLERVRCPILNIVAEGDYITPPESSLALGALAGSRQHEVVRMSGGHIGLSTGGTAHRTLWPRVAAWLETHDPLMHTHKNRPASAASMTRAHKNRKARS